MNILAVGAHPDYVEINYGGTLAKYAGDDNVYFLDGEQLWGGNFDCCRVDRTHPNDLGHYRMAQSGRMHKSVG